MGTFLPSPLSWPMKRLPESVQQVADVIGEAAALDLVRRWPRTKTNGDVPFRPIVYVPARLTPEHRLVAILGWTKAEALVRVFGGDIIFLATCANVVRCDRDDAIREALAKNATPAAIAIRFGITERRVRQIITKMRAEKSAMGSHATRTDHSSVIPQRVAA